jgi:hypothetical protein
VTVCRVALRRRGLPLDDLVAAHERATRPPSPAGDGGS